MVVVDWALTRAMAPEAMRAVVNFMLMVVESSGLKAGDV